MERIAQGSATKPGKHRTLGHINSELGSLFVETMIVHAKQTADRVIRDYGIDLTLRTFDDSGGPEPETISIQVKARQRWPRAKTGPHIHFRPKTHHLKLWRGGVLPVVLVLYDVSLRQAYWVRIRQTARLDKALRIPLSQVWNKESVLAIRGLKREVIRNARRRMPGQK